jgi:hypothetical protein
LSTVQAVVRVSTTEMCMGRLIRLDSLGRGVIDEGVEGASVDLSIVRNRMDICPLYK